jgi:hypothetical protein
MRALRGTPPTEKKIVPDAIAWCGRTISSRSPGVERDGFPALGVAAPSVTTPARPAQASTRKRQRVSSDKRKRRLAAGR